jgi:putative flippase GtrA
VKNQRSVVCDQCSEKPFTTEDAESTEDAIDLGEGRTLARWLKFNAVGAVGTVVQLGSLAVLNHVLVGRYLLATVLAIEITLLHNFVWLVRYRWRDREDSAGVGSLVRFHFSNGAVSMVGNLGLMPLLVGLAGMPVLVANGVAVLCCSVVNFWLGDGWVFTGSERTVLSD